MCFNQPTSLGICVFGICGTLIILYKTRNWMLTIGVFYFFLMELLQYFQYFFIDECDLFVNQFLTSLGLLHIAFQPYFCHLIVSGGVIHFGRGDKKLMKLVRYLCVVGGLALLARHIFGVLGMFIYDDVDGFLMGYDENGLKNGLNSTCGISPEWVRGKDLCTYSGRVHLAWSIPFASASYFSPGMFLHFFLMFVPFFVLPFVFDRKVLLLPLYGLALFFTGPFLAPLISDDLMEQGAIWCFFSMGQVIFIVGFIIFFDKKIDFFVKKAPKEKLAKNKQ